jgi:hypothetical protein
MNMFVSTDVQSIRRTEAAGSGSHGCNALYQGTTLEAAEKVLCTKGTALAVP